MLLRLLSLALAALVATGAGAEGGCAPSARAAACIQQALDQLAPGGTLRLSPGEYGLEAPLQFRRPGISLEGAGDATVLRRAVSVADGEGVLNFRGERQSLRHVRFDGAVTQPARIPYADPSGGTSVFGAPIYGNPMHPVLLADTSITIHRGASAILLEGITIQHTGGYAVLIDARYGDIREVTIRGCTLRNNRPHLFGVPAIDGRAAELRYGSWTGGIHYQNDGRDLPFARFALKGLTVEDCRFERIAGHGIWGHGYGFVTLNEDIVIRRNRFTDIGLDAIQIGNARRATVEANELRRIGFVTETDDDRSRPAWHPGLRPDMADNISPVGIDTTGLVLDSIYLQNTILSVNGTGIDLDGFTRGQVVANEVRVPGRENAYGAALDRVPEFGPHHANSPSPGNVTKGINLSNTAGAAPAERIRIARNRLFNLGGYAMLLLDLQSSVIEHNQIRHYSNLNGPIVLANTLREPRERHRTAHNIIRENHIYFPWHAACVTEADNIGAGDLPVAGPNFVYRNLCDALWGELTRGRLSGSRNAPPPATVFQPLAPPAAPPQ
jgi:hypothetical protein